MLFHNSIYTWKRRPVYYLGKQKLEFKQGTNFAPGYSDSAPCVCEVNSAGNVQCEATGPFPTLPHPSSKAQSFKVRYFYLEGLLLGAEMHPSHGRRDGCCW